MPANKNALIRYKTIDRCLLQRNRNWTLEDLVNACSDALYECEGIRKGVSRRTVQADIQMMRSDKLGYNAPIEVYDNKYYRYADPDYTIKARPLSPNDYEVMKEAVEMLGQLQDFAHFAEMNGVVSRLRENLAIACNNSRPVVSFDHVPELKGLRWLSSLYNYTSHRQTLHIIYRSFKATAPQEFDICPYMLKEFRNRWFLFGARATDFVMYNLALDRIISVTPSELPFRENPDFDAVHFFDDMIGVTKNVGDRPRALRFRATPEQTHYIRTKPLHPSQEIVEKGDDGSCEFEINVVFNYEMYSMLMSYGPGIRVTAPREAVCHMRKLLRTAAEAYDEEV